MYYNQRMNLEQELYHYGVLGMKWGQRRAIKKYSKNITKARSNMLAKKDSIYVKSYNDTAKKWDKKLQKFEKSHNPNSKTYERDFNKFMKSFEKEVNNTYGKQVVSELRNDKYYKKADSLANKHTSVKASDLYKETEQFIKDMDRGRH